jgi:hypothetical protein
MPRPHDYITFFCTTGFVIANLFGLALWVFGLLQTRLRFFYLLIVSALFAVALSTINVLVYYDPKLMPGLFGAGRFCALFLLVYLAAAVPVRVEFDWRGYHGSMGL